MLEFMKVKTEVEEEIATDARFVYNYPSDFILLALFVDEEGKKIVSEDQVEALKIFMIEELKQQYKEMKSNNIYYVSHSEDNSQNNALFACHCHRKNVGYSLADGVSTLALAQRIVKIFDKRQLEVVLPPEVVKLLLSLLPEEEKKNNKIYHKK